MNFMKFSGAEVKNWPGSNKLIIKSFKNLKPNLFNMLLVLLLLNIFSYAISTVLPKNGYFQDSALLLMWSYQNILLIYYSLANLRGENILLINAFKEVNKYYLRILLLTLIIFLASITTFSLFIVPFFVVFPRIILSPYLVVDRNMKVLEALKYSWKLTNGKYFKLLPYLGMYFLYFLAGIICMISVFLLPLFVYILLGITNSGALAYQLIYPHEKVSAKPGSKKKTKK